jgi:hypothetical protein
MKTYGGVEVLLHTFPPSTLPSVSQSLRKVVNNVVRAGKMDITESHTP